MRKVVVLLALSALTVCAPSLAVAAPPDGGPELPPPAQGRVDTPEAHSHEDHVHHDASDEARLRKQTTEMTAADAAVAAAAVAGPANVVGEWGPLTPWPVVGIHTALLPDGKVMSFDSVGDRATESFSQHDFTRATVWDPATGQHTSVNLPPGTFNLFCAGLAHLVDGTVFLAGGNKNSSLQGIAQTHVFKVNPYAWSRTADMAFERWYPSVTPLANSEMLITEGGPDTPEVRAVNGAIRQLTGATLGLPLYPWLDVAPDGRAFYSGPDSRMLSLTTSGSGSWQSVGSGDGSRDYGSRAVFDVGKVLVAGGAASRRDAAVIDFRTSTPTRTVTGSMASGRRQHNLTVLPDGTVLATGGNSSGAGLVDLNAGVYTAERWNPATGSWTTLAAQRQTRQYHSTATLLPDGRVLSAGGGICGTCDQVGYLAKDAEVFSPPYLFDASGGSAARPSISSAPASITTGSSFTVSTPEAASISKVALVRLGSSTHSTEMEQRYVPLTFTRGSGVLSVAAPANLNVAPPGPYMLFVLDGSGVPSVAAMTSVKPAPVVPNAQPTVSITSPVTGHTTQRRNGVTISATASDPDGQVSRVEFFRDGGAVKLGEDTTAPYSYSWKNPQVGSHTLVARVTDDRGAVVTSSRVDITVTR